MTQPKPRPGASPRRKTNPPAAPQAAQPLPFAPPKSNAQQAAREAAPQTPSGPAARAADPVHAGPNARAEPTGAAARAAAGPEPAADRRQAQAPHSRFVMLVVIPLVALALGFTWWLNSGRYVSTDNAYVGADKSLITPQVTGAIVAVHVVEGQKVKVGDPLFDIDPEAL